ncbi:putative O-glycosylation ligase, exosortase A system-associated [Motiliproteus coralliicola]|uniref:Putative O-glycosylation ligase, exosortase A system-associated n=1 Tax=Motiliproteus coralliicola TaxID=2283196 RepID=A0A369WSY7_9GAMM|nr:putative O-glycosylation ligase, exosortase A system-associated [Motiliproteus coralliicola]RDE24802.1 putative O-glycosylation ligase, exosortase A system-associated [Motiliproteus coralliicola]
MRDLLVALVIFGSIPFIFKRPFVGALMWCWISYMVPHRLGWGFITTFPVASIIGGCFLLAYLASKEPKKVPMNAVTVTLLAFILWMSITTLIAPSDSYKMDQFFKVIKIQLITFIILALLNSRQRIEAALWVVGLSIGFYGLKGGVFTVLGGGTSRVWGPPGGFFHGNNELALTLLINIPILIYLAGVTSNRWIRYGLFTIILFSIFSILGTHSRGSIVAGCAVCFFLWLKSNKKLLLSIAMVAVIPIALMSMPQHWYDRMNTIIQPDIESYDGSVQGRFNAWNMAFNLAKDKPFGGGFHATTRENFALYAPDPLKVHDSHSIYFQILGQHGFIGLFLYLLLWIMTWRTGRRVIALSKNNEQLVWCRNLVRMLQVSIIAFTTGGAFLGLAYFDLPYHIIITLVAILEWVKRYQLEHQPPPIRPRTMQGRIPNGQIAQ